MASGCLLQHVAVPTQPVRVLSSAGNFGSLNPLLKPRSYRSYRMELGWEDFLLHLGRNPRSFRFHAECAVAGAQRTNHTGLRIAWVASGIARPVEALQVGR